MDLLITLTYLIIPFYLLHPEENTYIWAQKTQSCSRQGSVGSRELKVCQENTPHHYSTSNLNHGSMLLCCLHQILTVLSECCSYVSRLPVLCIERCSSTYLGCSKRLFELPSCELKALWPSSNQLKKRSSNLLHVYDSRGGEDDGICIKLGINSIPAAFSSMKETENWTEPTPMLWICSPYLFIKLLIIHSSRIL